MGRSAQGYELQFAVNYLGHVHLARLLEGRLLAGGTHEARTQDKSQGEERREAR